MDAQHCFGGDWLGRPHANVAVEYFRWKAYVADAFQVKAWFAALSCGEDRQVMAAVADRSPTARRGSKVRCGKKIRLLGAASKPGENQVPSLTRRPEWPARTEFAAVVTSGSFAPRNVGVAISACSASASSWRAGLPKARWIASVWGKAAS